MNMLDNLKGWRTILLAVATAIVNGLATGDVLPPAWAEIYNLYILPPLMVILRTFTSTAITKAQ